MDQNLETLLKENLQSFYLLQIMRGEFGYLGLALVVYVIRHIPGKDTDFPVCEIRCSNAVDYSIRPKKPSIIEGGPPIKIPEQHELLNDPKLQYVPATDGEIFNPPIKFKLLEMGQSYVIAERFNLRPHEPNSGHDHYTPAPS